MANQLFVQVVKRSEDDFIINSISTDKKMWYLIPEEFKELKHHTLLSSKKIINNSIAAIKNVNGYRTIAIKIDEKIRNEYFDDMENPCFREFPLEEIVSIPISRVIEPNISELEDRIRQLEYQLKLNSTKDESKLQNIEKKIILDKFEKRQHDSMTWLSRFEDECHRFQLNLDSDKIQTLRFFVTGPAEVWYETNLKKIGLEAPWRIWKDSFLNVFVDKGWSIVRKAFNYKYLGGSLIDYALTKEKFCFQMEPNCSELSRINQIVFGLPTEAQDELDREKIITIDKLFAELRKLEDAFTRKKKDKPTSPKLNKNSDKKNEFQRKPCSICSALGFPNRYHLVAECRNKNWTNGKPKSNMIKHMNPDEAEILNTDLSNEDLN